MTNEEKQQFDDLAKALMTLFVMSGAESFHLAQDHNDNPQIGASEVVVLTITRKHKRIPPQNHPLQSFAGVLSYETV